MGATPLLLLLLLLWGGSVLAVWLTPGSACPALPLSSLHCPAPACPALPWPAPPPCPAPPCSPALPCPLLPRPALPPPADLEKVEVQKLGGLHVVGTERHESRRIDNQLRGRSGRQGDPGSTRYFLSLEVGGMGWAGLG